MANTRSPAVAGSFYPSDPQELREMSVGYCDDAAKDKQSLSGKLRGIIVPHAGYVYSGPWYELGSQTQIDAAKKYYGQK